MIIRAARRFACAHRFVVKRHRRDFAFVCQRCHVRKDELPVVRLRAAGKVIAFPVTAPADGPRVAPHHN